MFSRCMRCRGEMILTIHGLKGFNGKVVSRCKVNILWAEVLKCKECGGEEYIFPKMDELLEKIEDFRNKNLQKTDLYCIFRSDEWFVYGSFEEASREEGEQHVLR